MVMRWAIAIAAVLTACGPSPAQPIEPPAGRLDTDVQAERHVVVVAGTPLFETRDATQPRGWLGEADDIGGWTMRVVDDAGERVRVRAELDASAEHCARDLEGLSGLGIELYVPKSGLATVITREVTLTADECDTIIARPGVMVTALCEEDGVVRYRVGSCPNASCVYAVPADAIGHTYVAGPAAAPPPSEAVATPLPCVDAVDPSGKRGPHAVDGGGLGGLPATGLSRHGARPEPGKLPACELSNTALSCRNEPRLGFDHVAYELQQGTHLAWRDGTAAGVATRAHRFRAVPHSVGDRACWVAIEGSSNDEDLELCAAAAAMGRVEEAHAVVLQARRDGERTRWFDAEKATHCYREALATAPELDGRVHARFRVHDGGVALERVLRPGDETFARCLAGRLDHAGEDPHALDLVIELYPAVNGAARPPAPAVAPHRARDRSPDDRRR